MISAPLFWFDKKGHCHFNPMVPPLFAWEIRICARNVYFIATKVTSRASPPRKNTNKAFATMEKRYEQRVKIEKKVFPEFSLLCFSETKTVLQCGENSNRRKCNSQKDFLADV